MIAETILVSVQMTENSEQSTKSVRDLLHNNIRFTLVHGVRKLHIQQSLLARTYTSSGVDEIGVLNYYINIVTAFR